MGMTRRAFVGRSAVVVGASGAVSLPAAGAAAASGTSLTATRRATYAAVVAVVARANDLPHDGAAIRRATAAFEAEYAATSRTTREHMELVLDELATAGPSFADLSANAQRSLLREWRYAPTVPEDPTTTETTIRKHEIGRAAIDYASPPYRTTEGKPVRLTV